MRVKRYDSTQTFRDAVWEVLLENEVQNNLPIGLIKNERGLDTSDWLMAAVLDDDGGVLLTAACTPPFNLVLYETRNQPADGAVRLLADALLSDGIQLPGVLAEQGLAHRFAQSYVGEDRSRRHMSMRIMRLDRVADLPLSPGRIRPIREDDLYFAPYWAHAFAEECKVEQFGLHTHVERLRARVGKDTHYIWEDGIPVSQAVHGRSTEHGAVVNAVYTPPFYRGKGYATSAVAALSRMLLERGNHFCCLFADAENPISCGIYRKIGYVDQCTYDELRFIQEEATN